MPDVREPARSATRDRRSRQRGRGRARGPASGSRRAGGASGGDRAADRPLDTYEIEVLAGLAPLARAEAEASGMQVLAQHLDGLRVQAVAAEVLELRLAAAVYRRLAFAVPRPKALLGDQNLRRLATLLRTVAAPPARFRGFRFAAAGSDSDVFLRLGAALETATGLRFDADGGELLVRVRPVPDGEGWEVLARLTPRPLSARSWRVCNRAGGLNATLAAAMVRVAGVGAGDRYLNLMCGSGTLLVERFLAGPVASITGLDVDPEALACAAANVEAAGAAGACSLVLGDVRQAPLGVRGYDVITADLPWGDAVGSHRDNARLHPALLDAADRLGAPGVRLALLTHELRLFEKVLRGQDRWRVTRQLQVAHGGHHPRLYLLKRA